MNRVERCPKCSALMTEGFLIDSSHNAVRVAHWAEDPPSYWFLKVLRMKGRRRLPVETWRCSRCGFLESWAREPRR